MSKAIKMWRQQCFTLLMIFSGANQNKNYNSFMISALALKYLAKSIFFRTSRSSSTFSPFPLQFTLIWISNYENQWGSKGPKVEDGLYFLLTISLSFSTSSDTYTLTYCILLPTNLNFEIVSEVMRWVHGPVISPVALLKEGSSWVWLSHFWEWP